MKERDRNEKGIENCRRSSDCFHPVGCDRRGCKSVKEGPNCCSNYNSCVLQLGCRTEVPGELRCNHSCYGNYHDDSSFNADHCRSDTTATKCSPDSSAIS